MVLKTHHNILLKKKLGYVFFWDIMQCKMNTEFYISISALHDDKQQSLRNKQMHMCRDQALITDEDTQLTAPPTWHYQKKYIYIYIYIYIKNSSIHNTNRREMADNNKIHKYIK